jgi:LysR family transcriptional activator of nhaA
MPASESSLGQRLRAWFQVKGLHPHVVGEFDDAALAHEFGRRGAGFFAAPTLLAFELESQLRVEPVGIAVGVEEEFFAISVERRITHPCVATVTRVARGALTQKSRPGAKKRRSGGRRRAS